jgi:hypothetical protein
LQHTTPSTSRSVLNWTAPPHPRRRTPLLQRLKPVYQISTPFHANLGADHVVATARRHPRWFLRAAAHDLVTNGGVAAVDSIRTSHDPIFMPIPSTLHGYWPRKTHGPANQEATGLRTLYTRYEPFIMYIYIYSIYTIYIYIYT